MPVHIGEIESDVTVLEDELPLNEKQLERIVDRVLRRLEDLDRHANLLTDTITVRTGSGKGAPQLRYVPRASYNRS